MWVLRVGASYVRVNCAAVQRGVVHTIGHACERSRMGGAQPRVLQKAAGRARALQMLGGIASSQNGQQQC